jgi:hypothetical protein
VFEARASSASGLQSAAITGLQRQNTALRTIAGWKKNFVAYPIRTVFRGTGKLVSVFQF